MNFGLKRCTYRFRVRYFLDEKRSIILINESSQLPPTKFRRIPNEKRFNWCKSSNKSIRSLAPLDSV